MVGEDVTLKVTLTLDASGCEALLVSVADSDTVPLREDVDVWLELKLPATVTLELTVDDSVTLGEGIWDDVEDTVRVTVGDILCVPDNS